MSSDPPKITTQMIDDLFDEQNALPLEQFAENMLGLFENDEVIYDFMAEMPARIFVSGPLAVVWSCFLFGIKLGMKVKEAQYLEEWSKNVREDN